MTCVGASQPLEHWSYFGETFMPSFNAFSLMGNLGANPELRYTPGGAPICTFSVAVNSRRKNGDSLLVDRVDFFRVTAKFKLAVVCQKYLKKGSLVFVHGELESWRNEGKFGINFLASNVQFLGGTKRAAAGTPGEHADDEVWDEDMRQWVAEFSGEGATEGSQGESLAVTHS
jgi:single stranded DNA-binding protein